MKNAIQSMTGSSATNTFPSPGAHLQPRGVEYRVWAPQAEAVVLNVYDPEAFRDLGPRIVPGKLPEPFRTIPLEEQDDGHFAGIDEQGAAGDLYTLLLNNENNFPDPASRRQPFGVHGPSMVVDPTQYVWGDSGWNCPPVRDLVIYELHIGTFTKEGTFLAAIEKLQHVRDLGATAVEIMPIGDFPGDRNWGYDGVYLYAPAQAYGTPDDFRALVDAAHQIGLAVILDVVYNHFGPDGNYLAAYIGEYLDESSKTPWGGAIRYGSPYFQPLREMVAANPTYWMSDFHVDGFRLDATHAIEDSSNPHLLQEMASRIHQLGGFAIAEDPRNDSNLLLPEPENGFGFDGVWADDFHHTLRVGNTGENEGYLGDFSGSLSEVVDTLRHGWFYRGQPSRDKGRSRGSECYHIPPWKFVHCISNHDQTGNQAFGERIGHKISPEAYRASSALLLLSPYMPLLFMGQEWNASSPFQFFTDHNEELGRLVTEGRREEFKDFAAFKNAGGLREIPDPQDPSTFYNSKLNWDEVTTGHHALMLAFYQECLSLRLSDQAFRPHSREGFRVSELPSGIGALRLLGGDTEWLVLFDLVGGHSCDTDLEPECRPSREGAIWKLALSSNEKRFGGTGREETLGSVLQFEAAECAVYKCETAANAQ